MAADRSQNLQDTFLNHVRKSKTPLTIFLVNGVKLQGVVTWFDNFCVLLRRDGHSQLVYKHAISTIMPGHPIKLFEGAEEPRPPGKRSDWSHVVATEARPTEPPRARSRAGAQWSSNPYLRHRARRLAAGRKRPRAAARLDEAVGLARAIDLDVVQAGIVPIAAASAPRPTWARARSRSSPASSKASRSTSSSWTARSRRCSSATSRTPGAPRCSTAPG